MEGPCGSYMKKHPHTQTYINTWPVGLPLCCALSLPPRLSPRTYLASRLATVLFPAPLRPTTAVTYWVVGGRGGTSRLSSGNLPCSRVGKGGREGGACVCVWGGASGRYNHRGERT